MSEVINIKELNERIERESVFVDTLRTEMGKVIVGQSHLVDTLLIGLLSNGHILLEGVPGLAKTLAITTLAKAVDARFSRIQFTPDLLPADLLGTLIYSQKNEEFLVKKGPVFANFILADEINRSPAKVQSALLEAMQAAGQPWAVSSLAQAAGLAALDETAYVAQVRALIAQQRPRLPSRNRSSRRRRLCP